MKVYLPLFFVSLHFVVNAQQEKTKLRDGNTAYKGGNYTAAATKYKEALETKKNYTRANYNLGNALYKQKSFEDAKGQYEVMINSTSNKDTLAGVYHNMGNSYLKMKRYDEAIKAYKTSLKMNPADEETRYNLAWAQKKLQQEGGKGGSQSQDKQGGNKEEQDKNAGKKIENKENKEQQEQQVSMSKDEAKRMLEALKNHERKLMEEKKEKDKDNQKSDVEKDW